MSLRLSAHHIRTHSEGSEDYSDARSSSSEEEDDGDLTWDDWVSDSMANRPCKSLFDETVYPSVAEALNHDKSLHGFDLEQTCSRLGLDSHQRIRLINWIRKEKPTPSEVINLKGDESFLNADEYLVPALEDDPLLLQPQDWSEDEDENVVQAPPPANLPEASHRIRTLQKKLQQAKQDMADYRKFVNERLNLAGLAESLQKECEVEATRSATPLRDDDSHYFQSYGVNDIHAVMIQDKVRTATYASFILTNPDLFQNATVLDVGCGTGILSLFAARSGAKRVFAVDASDVIVEKAKQIVKDNGFDGVITVVHGKVEDIKLPEDVTQVDIIVSEWMGYALLYESMLDSVLHARDRFLKPAGVMAPSQCKMMFALCDAHEIFKERIGFWSDIYGFDLSAMGTDVYDDAVVDVVGPEDMASEPFVVKDLYLRDINPRQLDFSTPFTLVSTVERRTKIHAFVLYFDTFFTTTGEPVPEGTEVYIVREGDPMLAEVWQVGGKRHVGRRLSTMNSGDVPKPKEPKITSFSTGPKSVPTHWKQTLFLLRDPIMAHEGTTVQGVFKCRKSDSNSRELDIEIHYTVKEEGQPAEAGDAVVQMFKVR